MPGSIHVSVLEASNLPEEILDGKDVAIKVVVGTREYQTVPCKVVGGKTAPLSSDFVFPVLNLRDNLLVILLGENGEGISKSEIETSSIVEKGSFDVNLLLNGGGNVHLSLSFVLTEEERRRIDIMRAAALKRREQEALKRSASTQSLPVEIGSFEEQSTPAESLERGTEKAGVAKDSSTSVISKEPEPNLHEIVKGASERYINPSESAGKNTKFTNVCNGNQEPTESLNLALTDDGGQATADQVAQRKLDILDSSETDSEGQSVADLEKIDATSEEKKELVHEPPHAKLESSSSSVKAKINAFEKTTPQGATKQNPAISTSINVQELSPRNKRTARKKVKGDEPMAKVNKPLDDFIAVRTTDKTSEPANQTRGGERHKNILMRSEAASETSEAGYTSTKENCPPDVSMTRPEDDGSQHTAQGEQPKHYEDKSSSMQRNRNINLVSLSKQVLSGAISGAVLVAALALLWAVNPKRNSSSQQRSKQRRQT